MFGIDCVQICLVFLIAFSGCSKTQVQEPVASDSDLSGIDPNQKAVAKDAPIVSEDASAATSQSESKAQSTPDDQSAIEAATNIMDPVAEPKIQDDVTSPAVAAPATIGKGPKTRFIKAATLNIRSQPNRRSKIVGSLRGGDKVRVKIYDGWAKLDEGQWIRSRWLVKTPPSGFSSATDDESAQPQKRSTTKLKKRRIQRK